MTIPAPNLDDRTFQDIVDEAKGLIPRFCPQWTNHNVSDPGVALIELFAWMSELVLYRLNQVPDRLYVHFLNLVGIEPFAPSVARADLTFHLTAARDEPVTVPAGTEVATAAADDRDAVVFTTVEPLVVRQPRLAAALTAAGGDEQRLADAWDDLRLEGQRATCFTSSPPAPGDALYLGFDESVAGTLLCLSVQATAEGIGIRPAEAPLAWEVSDGGTWTAVDVIEDTTGGLNRDGHVVLNVPRRHTHVVLAERRAYWLRVRLVAVRAGQPTYESSPRILRLAASALGGTVAAEHSARAGRETLGRSNGRPGQSFPAGRSPALALPDGETVRVVEVDGTTTEWTRADDFSASGPDDRHFTWDAAGATVRFGPRVRYADGSARQHGAVPPDGAAVSISGYRYGGGVSGNVGSGALTVLRSTWPFVDHVTNLASATGGADAESVAEAKERAPFWLRTGNRAVTAGDYERLTLEASAEVARARCVPGDAPGRVRVLVIPRATSPTGALDDFALSDALFDVVAAKLDATRIVGTTVEVGTPHYQGVSVVALLRAGSGLGAAVVRARARAALARYVHPLTGGPDGRGWPFDTDLNSADVRLRLEAVDGVARVEEVLLFAYDLRNRTRVGVAKDVVSLEPDAVFLSAANQVIVA